MDLTNVNYISAEPLVAQIKLQLKNYFESGVLTEALIPTFIDNALRKLGSLSLKPHQKYVINIKDYTGYLPSDFFKLILAYTYDYVYEFTGQVPATTGWYVRHDDCVSCTNCPNPGGVYEEIRINSHTERVKLKNPKLVKVVYSSEYCASDCPNKNYESLDEVVISGNRVTTSFETGALYMNYFSKPLDDDGIPMIPEIVEVEDYIIAWVKFLLMELVLNGASPETYNQSMQKYQLYERQAFMKYESALNILKQQDRQQSIAQISRNKKQHLKFLMK